MRDINTYYSTSGLSAVFPPKLSRFATTRHVYFCQLFALFRLSSKREKKRRRFDIAAPRLSQISLTDADGALMQDDEAVSGRRHADKPSKAPRLGAAAHHRFSTT